MTLWKCLDKLCGAEDSYFWGWKNIEWFTCLFIHTFVHSLHIELRIVGAKVPNMIGKIVFVYYYSAPILVASATTVVMSLTPCYAALYH